MSNFFHFFSLGFLKIAYLDVFVHILFIVALCGVYTFKSIRLVGSFALCFLCGYLFTFILATFGLVNVPSQLLKLILPLTTLGVAISNFFLKKNAFVNKYPPQNYRYFLAITGGLFHGLDFPSALRPVLGAEKLIVPLFAFSLGIVLALLLIVLFLLLTSFVLTYLLRVNIREWNLLLSGACAGISIYILMNEFLYNQILK